MNSPTSRSPRSCSQAGGRRSSRPPSHLHSDCPPEPEDSLDSPNLGQRSVSLTTLQPAVIQPRMAQLETLEAKMASIEVSLSSTPRRKKNGSLSSVNLGSSIRTVPKEFALKELESLRNALRDKENIIQNLRGQLGMPGFYNSLIKTNGITNGNNREHCEIERKQAEERLIKLRGETDNKRLAIKNLKMALERLDITDNIDIRIQQAELEYQLGREELNLLTLLEETKTIQICLEESSKNSSELHTLYSCVSNCSTANLYAVEIVYDPKSPRFGAGSNNSNSGLWIDWALEDTGLYKGDRLIEVNGKIVLNKTREDLMRLLAAAPDPAQIVLLRKNAATKKNTVLRSTSYEEVATLRSELGVVRERAEETQKVKDSLVSDNIRLTHRISYLEEQVAELLTRKNVEAQDAIKKKSVLTSTVKTSHNVTNINITAQPSNKSSSTNGTGLSDLQIFQKGPQVTALVANLPGLDVSQESHTSLPVRSKSSLSNVSNTHIPAPNLQNGENHSCHRSHRHRHRSPKSRGLRNGDDPEGKAVHKNRYHFGQDKEYYTDSRNKEHAKVGEYNSNAALMDQSYKKASMIVHDLTKTKENGYDSMYEKHRQKCISASEQYNTHLLKHYNARKSASVLDFRSQINTKYKESRSSERLDIGENDKVPIKQLNHRKIIDSRSVKSLDFDSDSNIPRREKVFDYTSEPIDSFDKPHHLHPMYLDNIKPRPMPPKKPLRLSLHKTQSLQSVETPLSTPKGSPDKNSSRKPVKRSHNGDTQYINVKIEGSPERQNYSTKDYTHRTSINGLSALKWSSFNSAKYVENGK